MMEQIVAVVDDGADSGSVEQIVAVVVMEQIVTVD